MTVTTSPAGEMSKTLIQRKRTESHHEIVLRLLEEVETDESVSQARFAKRIGIAKGLANVYFNRCLQKGWIKLRQVPKQRFLYYLTPKGFAEKARLSAEFLTHSYRFYLEARADLVALMIDAVKQGHSRLAILGAGELAEIAAIVSEDTPAIVVGFFDPRAGRQRIAGRPVASSWSELGEAQAAILATLENPRSVLERFLADQPTVPVLVPKQLRSLLWKKKK